MSECDKLPAGRRRICDGTSGLPLARVNDYRESWGLAPLSELPKGVTVKEPSKKVRASVKPTKPATKTNSGPGTELAAIFDAKGVPSCQQCRALASRMDRWGIAGCRDRMEEIIEDIFPRAKEWVQQNRKFVHALLPSAVEDFAIRTVIRSHVETAIENAEKRTVKIEKPFPEWKAENHEQLLAQSEIIVKSFRRQALLLKFVQSVRRFYPDLSIRVVDDSGELTEAGRFVQSFANLHWHNMPFDSGLPAGRNVAVRESQAKYVIVCDDDFIFTEDTDLAAMLIPLRETDLDLCGGLVRWQGKTPTNWCGTLHLEGRGKRSLVMRPDRTEIESVLGVRFRRTDITFNFFAARRDSLLSHPWDERYKISEEHLDSFLSWKQAGLRVAYTLDSICDHAKTSDKEYQKLRDRRSDGLLDKKWGISKRKTIPPTRFEDP
jgi:GT2 family glycosyltransferase